MHLSRKLYRVRFHNNWKDKIGTGEMRWDEQEEYIKDLEIFMWYLVLTNNLNEHKGENRDTKKGKFSIFFSIPQSIRCEKERDREMQI